jgi:hypothetical protein
MALGDAFEELGAFLAGYQQARKKEPSSPVEVLIICPDCGRNPPFRHRCPKCGGDSWIPAGLVSGIFEWVKARQWRSVVGPPPHPGETPLTEPQAREMTSDKRKARRKRRRGNRQA